MVKKRCTGAFFLLEKVKEGLWIQYDYLGFFICALQLIMYLNFHSHTAYQPEHAPAVRNIILGKEALCFHDLNDWVSAGIHPWYINEAKVKGQLEELSLFVKEPNVKLIGECGLDRLRGCKMAIQLEVFEAQIRIAEGVNKPVIVHCVKGFSELLEIKKRLRPAVPLIIHGFNNKLQTANQLLSNGFYFSLGPALLNERSNAATVLRAIPLDRLFLETDDKEEAIEMVYRRAAALLNIELDYLKEIIFANWMSLQE